ncbi:hypothetical protein KIH13_15465 [Pseudomonas viridiflava]|nr:hypothetical protein KIH13_15465 [Pseudomonas viridiflava]
MKLKTVGAWTLAAIMGSVSAVAMAGSTGPTNPDSSGPKVPGTGMEKNTDGTTPGTQGTSPGTKGMDPQPGNNSGMDKKMMLARPVWTPMVTIRTMTTTARREADLDRETVNAA